MVDKQDFASPLRVWPAFRIVRLFVPNEQLLRMIGDGPSQSKMFQISFISSILKTVQFSTNMSITAGVDPEGTHPAPPPPSPSPLKLGGGYDFFLRKIVIFHSKYPKNVRASLRSARFF